MNNVPNRRWAIGLFIILTLMIVRLPTLAVETPSFNKLLAGKDVRPGLVVVLPCSDEASAVGLSTVASGVVQGLMLDATALNAARRELQSRKVYGRVSLDLLSKGQLPYATASANAVIVGDVAALANHGIGWPEILRVTAPYGVILIHAMDAKPIRAALTGLTFIPVADVAGWYKVTVPYPPGMDEWTQQGYDASGTAQSNDQLIGPPTMLRWINGPTWADYQAGSLVSANGRAFFRHGDRSASANKAGNYEMLTTLDAVDAFNGYKLWTRPIVGYEKSGRPIAAGNRVYAVLPDSEKKLVALDAATGEIALRYEFVPTDDLRLHRGVFLNKAGTEAWDAATGWSLWKATQHRQPLSRSILSGGELNIPFVVDAGDQLFCVVSNEIVCCDLGTGQRKWSAPLQSNGATEGIDCARKGVVLTLENPVPMVNRNGLAAGEDRVLRAYSGVDGKFLWSTNVKGWNHKFRLFFGDELAVFAGEQGPDKQWPNTYRGKTVALDLLTGKEQRVLTTSLCPVFGSCAEYIGTAQWMICGTKPIQMFNPATGRFFAGSTVRSLCGVGPVAANGLLYQGLNFCKCTRCLRGDAAFAPDTIPDPSALTAEQRLEKGPAFSHPLADAKTAPDDWPIFRHDALRHNTTPADIPEQLTTCWHAEFSAAPSGATVAGKQVFCALPEAHAVCALDAATGKQQWLFTAGARIDSPPTFNRGRVVFGSRDGWLYCLDATTGELAWRVLVAPADHRMLVRGQLESNWPLFGSPVMNDAGVIFTSAGRHSESGGGIYCAAIELATGKFSWQSRVGPFSITTDPAQAAKTVNIAAENNDLLFFDSRQLLLPCYTITPATGKVEQRIQRKPPDVDALIPGPLGLLDESNLTVLRNGQWHMQSSCRGHLARVWCLDDQNQWALGRAGDSIGELTVRGPIEDALPLVTNNQKVVFKPDWDFFVSGLINSNRWVQKLPHEAQAKAILHAGSVIFIAAILNDPADDKGIVYRFDAATGAPRSTIPLSSAPVFDGLSVGQHCLFAATRIGLCCLGQR